MSGVFSIASHWALQYLPAVVTQEQTGCAHFSPFVVSISFLLEGSMAVAARMLYAPRKQICAEWNTMRDWPIVAAVVG